LCFVLLLCAFPACAFCALCFVLCALCFVFGMADAQAAVPTAADSSAPTQAAGDARFLKCVWLTPAFAHRTFDPVPG
jgi:hypothetical protein